MDKKDKYLKVFEEIMNRRDDSIDNRTTARKNSVTCGKYILHEQFSADEIEKAEKYKKPLVRYNVLVSKINTLLGNELNNRRLAIIVPQYWTDEKLVQILNDNFDAISEANALEEKMIKLLADALIFPTGGWIKRSVKLNEYNYLEFKYDLLDTMFVHPDPEMKDSDLSDAAFVVYDQWMTLDEIREAFGANKYFDDEDKYKTWEKTTTLINNLERKFENKSSPYKEGNRYLVCQMEKKELLKSYALQLEDGKYCKATEKEIKMFEKNKVPFTVIAESKSVRIHLSAIAPYFENVVLQDEESPFPTDRFSCFPCFSFDWNILKADTPSLVYYVLDIQDRINKGMSQHVDFVTQALGSAWHVPKTEREAMEILQDKGNEPGVVIPYANINNKAIRDTAPPLPPDLLNTASFDIKMVDDITNITPSMEGFSEKSGETGVLFDSKVRQALSATNMYYESIAKTMRNIKADYVELAPYVYFEPFRVLPIKQVGNTTGLDHEIINIVYPGRIERDIKSLEARVVLEEVQNTPNHLEKTFNENMALVNILISSGATFIDIPWELIIKHSTARDKDKWIEWFAQVQQSKLEDKARMEADADMNSLVNTAQVLNQADQQKMMAGKNE